MTIQNELTNLITTKSAIKQAIINQGVSVSDQDGFASYATKISQISGGGEIGITREVSAQGVYQMPASNFTFSLPNNAIDIGNYALYYAFYNCTNLTSVDLSSLTTLSGNYAMYSAFNGCPLISLDLSSLTTVSGSSAMSATFGICASLTSLDLSSLTTVSGSSAMYGAFNRCTNLTSVDLSSLTTVSGSGAMGNIFKECSNLTSVDLSNLTTITGSSVMSQAFYDCTELTSINFTKLKTIGVNTSTGDNKQFTECFRGCTKLTIITFSKLEKIYCTGSGTASNGTFYNNNKIQKLYFPKLNTITYGTGASSTNQNACKNVFYGCSSLTEIHFGAANQAAIEASPGYSTLWGRGAGNATVYFDL